MPLDSPPPTIHDVAPLVREVHADLRRQGFKYRIRPKLQSVGEFPFKNLVDQGFDTGTEYAAAAIIVSVDEDDPPWMERMVGHWSIDHRTARLAVRKDWRARQIFTHELLHAVCPKASEGVTDAVAYDATNAALSRRAVWNIDGKLVRPKDAIGVRIPLMESQGYPLSVRMLQRKSALRHGVGIHHKRAIATRRAWFMAACR